MKCGFIKCFVHFLENAMQNLVTVILKPVFGGFSFLPQEYVL